MAYSRRNNKRSSSVMGWISSAVLICVLAGIVVGTGAYDHTRELLGLSTTGTQVEDLKSKDNTKLRVPDWVKTNLPTTTTPHSQYGGVQTNLPAQAYSPISYQQALDYARTIPVTPAHPQGYNRDSQFGGWKKSPHLCKFGTTRDWILKRDLTNVTLNAKCHVTSGDFVDPYTGKSMRFTRGVKSSMDIQIDHVVALQDAWASGAYQWSQERRVQYANSDDVLLASDGQANMAKGAGVDWSGKSNPVWLPSNVNYQCDYMSKRVAIKHAWGLSMSQAEKDQSVAVLQACVTR